MALREGFNQGASDIDRRGGRPALTVMPLQTKITLDLPAWHADPRHPANKIGLPQSLDVGHVRQVMTRQMEVVILDDGTVARVNHEPTEAGVRRTLVLPDGRQDTLYEARPDGDPYHNHDLLARVRGGAIAPVARWGEHAVLIQHLEDRHPLLTDIPETQLRQYLGLIAGTMKEFQHDEDGQEQPVQFGMCVSPASMNKDEVKSGQTVIAPHGQVTANPQLRELTNWTIEGVRDAQVWDGGISLHLGERLVEDIGGKLQESNPSITGTADPMGARFRIPGLTIDDINSMEFVDNLLRPIFEGAQKQVEDSHNSVFTGTWQDALNVVQEERRKKPDDLDMARYNRIFDRKPSAADSPLPDEITGQLHALYDAGEIRWPPGWSFALRFSPGEDPMIAITFGVAKLDHGPDEGLGIKPNRMTSALSADAAHAETVFIGRKLENVVQTLQQQ